MIEVYSDGSSHAKGGKPGGWASVVVQDNQVKRLLYGGHPSTTNNRMEMTGAIEGLKYVIEKALKAPDEKVVLVSDSQLTLGFASGEYQPTKNQDLVDILRQLMIQLQGTTRWVKGHNGDSFNERCDRFANKGKQEAIEKLSLIHI